MVGVRKIARALLAAAVVVVAASCAPSESPTIAAPASLGGGGSSTTVAATAPSTTAAPRPTTTIPVPAPPVRAVVETRYAPFARVGGVTLFHPSARVERVGFHQSAHDGARQLRPLPSAANAVTLETRDRGTGARTAADVVVDPNGAIRSPVTGTVVRAGSYVLYCEHSDDFVVIAPDGHPGWEVKILHIDGEQVSPGQRVVAGQTLLAPRPTQLPFESQVDELTPMRRAWPHVHVEVVDPTIPDRPSPGGGCK